PLVHHSMPTRRSSDLDLFITSEEVRHPERERRSGLTSTTRRTSYAWRALSMGIQSEGPDMTSKKRRHYGTGNVSQRANGKWVGRFDAGYSRTGHRKLSELTASNIRQIHTHLQKADHCRPPPSAPTPSSRRSSRTHAATATPPPPRCDRRVTPRRGPHRP